MTATAICGAPDARTSALGCLKRPAPDADFRTVATSPAGSDPTTTSTAPHGSAAAWNAIASRAEGTASEPAGKALFPTVPTASSPTTGQAVMEIRRLSGLTWEELADLFDVSRRSLHHWANGKTVTAEEDRTIRGTLAAIRHLHRGGQAGTRALLLAVDQTTGVSAFDLLRNRLFDEAKGRVEDIRPPEPRRIPLSDAAREARRPPAPTLLLGAEQEQPDIPAKVRTVRARRIPGTTR